MWRMLPTGGGEEVRGHHRGFDPYIMQPNLFMELYSRSRAEGSPSARRDASHGAPPRARVGNVTLSSGKGGLTGWTVEVMGQRSWVWGLVRSSPKQTHGVKGSAFPQSQWLPCQAVAVSEGGPVPGGRTGLNGLTGLQVAELGQRLLLVLLVLPGSR
jgi:hypothetical protein